MKKLVYSVLIFFFLCVGALGYGMYIGINAVEVQRIPEPRDPTRAEKCAHLYDTDKHREWAACMGVTYR